jgi:hypothetical protein
MNEEKIVNSLRILLLPTVTKDLQQKNKKKYEEI